MLAVEADRAAWALAVEAVHLINASTARASGVSFESALIDIDGASFTTEALFAAASKRVLLVDKTHAIVKTKTIWAFGRLETLRYAVVQLFVKERTN